MKIISSAHKVSGHIKVPGSKSHTIRALLLSAMAEGTSKIYNPLPSEDCLSAARAIPLLGADVDFGGKGFWSVRGAGPSVHLPSDVVNVGNSGSLLYFLSPICATFNGTSIFTGDESIRKRPVDHVANVICQMGAESWCAVPGTKTCPLVVKGPATFNGDIQTECSVSSQYITGLMMAAMLKNQTLQIRLSNPKETPYLTMTKLWLEEFGAQVSISDDFKEISVKGPEKISARDSVIPSDWEGVAFPLLAAVLTDSTLTIDNVDFSGSQGDDKIVQIFTDLGADIVCDKETSSLVVRGCKGLSAKKFPGSVYHVNLSGLPDAICAVAAAACFTEGSVYIEDIAVCRRKETDRIKVLKCELEKLGASVEEGSDFMVVHGKRPLHGGTVQSYKDHRVAMSLSCMGLAIGGGESVSILDAECASVSFPGFYDAMNQIGAGFVSA